MYKYTLSNFPESQRTGNAYLKLALRVLISDLQRRLCSLSISLIYHTYNFFQHWHAWICRNLSNVYLRSRDIAVEM